MKAEPVTTAQRPPIFRLMMDARRLARFLLAALACLLAGAPAALAQGLAGSRPNIVLIITDDQGYAPIGRLGHPWIKTPHLDAMHDASVRFTRFLVSPVSAPTRAAIMTGRDPLKNGVTHTIHERERLTLAAVTLPQVLKSAGYSTGIFGKWHLGDEAPYQPERRGFDEVFIHGGGGIGQYYTDCSSADAPANQVGKDDASKRRYYDPVIRHNGTFVQTRGFCTDVFFNAALGWIKERHAAGKEPFFAYLATNAPHLPFVAPAKNIKRFTDLGFSAQQAGREMAGFYGMIENIDENVGRFLANLDAWGLSENTVVIFMSDNGMSGGVGERMPNEPLGRDKDGTPLRYYNAGMKGRKSAVDEGGVRVPFFVRWRGRLRPGRDIDRIAAHLDILPTFAALAGAKLPGNQVEGRSLIPLLENSQAPWADRYLFTHASWRCKPGENPDDFQWEGFAVRNQRFRLVGKALYEMEADPGQTTDVAAAHSEVVQSMRAAWDRHWKEARPLMVNAHAPLSTVQPYGVWYREQVKTRGIPEWKAPNL